MHKTDKNSSMVVPHAALSIYLLIIIYCHRGNTSCAFIATQLSFMNCMVLGSQGKCGFVCKTAMFCCALLCVHSSFAIISMGKRKLVALLCSSSWCLVFVVWLFLMMPRV